MTAMGTFMVLATFLACGEAEPPEPVAGTLSTKPVDAKVFLDGFEVGTTPWTPDAEKVPLTVVVRANGYQRRSAEVGSEDVMIELSPGCEELLGYDGVFANGYALTPAELAVMKPPRIGFLRNEVFARYGRAFNKDRYQEHFAKQAWYMENPHYDDAVLTEVDKANLELLKSFEGDPERWAERILERNQFKGMGRTLAFTDADTVVIAKGVGDIYESETFERRWMARGQWVITWEEPETFRPGAKGARLWKLDIKTGRVTESEPLSPARG